MTLQFSISMSLFCFCNGGDIDRRPMEWWVFTVPHTWVTPSDTKTDKIQNLKSQIERYLKSLPIQSSPSQFLNQWFLGFLSHTHLTQMKLYSIILFCLPSFASMLLRITQVVVNKVLVFCLWWSSSNIPGYWYIIISLSIIVLLNIGRFQFGLLRKTCFLQIFLHKTISFIHIFISLGDTSISNLAHFYRG